MRHHIQNKISIVIPIYNELNNITILIKDLIKILKNNNFEIIVVDDGSTDGSIIEILNLCNNDHRINIIQRMNDRGLVQSIKFGIQSISGEFFIVMDGDGQHDPNDINKMLNLIKHKDLIIGYRNLKKLETITPIRKLASIICNHVINIILRTQLKDPLTGFFMGRSSILNKKFFNMNTEGFKILIDLVYSNKNKILIDEVMINFRNRKFGESKLDSRIAFSFVTQMISLSLFGLISSKFIGFSLIGITGLLVHASIFYFLINIDLSFFLSFLISTIFATFNNFFLNHFFNFVHSSGCKSKKVFIYSLTKYFLITLPGTITSIGASNFIYTEYNLGILLPAFIGITMDITFKYFLSKKWVWGNY